jgi:hypothetical protein
MTAVTEKDEEGTDRVVASGTKVVTGTVERITGAGKVIVYPSEDDPELKEGEEAIIVTKKQTTPSTEFGLELLREQVSSPYPSNFGILVKALSRSLNHCAVYCGGTQLSVVDATGTTKNEIPLTLGSSLVFRVPADLPLHRDTSVELRDGSVTVLLNSLSSLPGSSEL